MIELFWASKSDWKKMGIFPGKGKTVQRKTVTVPVPAGVEDGQTVRMPVGNKEIFVSFRVSRSDTFRREGADIHSDCDISLSMAALGGTVKVEGIYEDHQVNIPPGTSSHTRIQLPAKGIRKLNSYGYGDHYVHIKIKVPKKLTDKQRETLAAFAETDKTVKSGTVNKVKVDDSTASSPASKERSSVWKLFFLWKKKIFGKNFFWGKFFLGKLFLGKIFFGKNCWCCWEELLLLWDFFFCASILSAGKKDWGKYVVVCFFAAPHVDVDRVVAGLPRVVPWTMGKV